MTKENERRLAQIKASLPDYMDERREEHTLGVYAECAWMAKAFSLDGDDTYSLLAAALLHDITKCKSHGEQLSLCRRYGIVLPEDISSVSATLHQYTAAPFALERFGEESAGEKVRSAVSCHTTGRAGMTLLDKLLFCADFTEAGRKYRSCMEMREYLHGGCEKINKKDGEARVRLLDDTVKRIIGFTVTYLLEKGRKIDAEMLSAWNALISPAAF